MRRAILVLLISILCAPAWAQVQSTAYDVMLQALLRHSVPEVSVKKLAQMKGVILLDTREASEYNVSHINGALWIGPDGNEDVLKKISKGEEIVVYCSVGYRSEKVAEKLTAANYKRVANLYGGIFEWVNQGYPVVDNSGKETGRIHAYNRTWGVWLNRGRKVYDED